jgi:hypothetical protein
MNTYRKITIVLFVVIVLGITSGAAIAGAPPPVPTQVPTPAPPPSGGYTPPSYSAAPSFQPYTEDVKSTDGSVIGKLAGIDFTTVRLTASRSATIDGGNFSVDLGADMSSKPLDATLDITIGDEGNVPEGMDNVIMLTTASISSQSRYGWSIKTGTLTLKFTIPASRLGEATAETKYYIVRYDGTGYQIIPVTVTTSDSSATIEAKIPDISGTYSLVMSCPPKPAPTSTPLPTPEPTPAVPCPTPAPASSGIMGWLPSLWASAFGTFAIGEVAGAFILIALGRFMK